jgi:hypothetical protein
MQAVFVAFHREHWIPNPVVELEVSNCQSPYADWLGYETY